jgi:hypothetical protein
MRFPFADVSIEFLAGWFDVTDSLPEGTPPTLGKSDYGYGALQFTTARYLAGEKPKFDKRVLQEVLREFEISHQWPIAPAISDAGSSHFGTFGIYADYANEVGLTRVWYISDGEHLTFVTYIAGISYGALQELDEAHQMVNSIRF